MQKSITTVYQIEDIPADVAAWAALVSMKITIRAVWERPSMEDTGLYYLRVVCPELEEWFDWFNDTYEALTTDEEKAQARADKSGEIPLPYILDVPDIAQLEALYATTDATDYDGGYNWEDITGEPKIARELMQAFFEEQRRLYPDVLFELDMDAID